MEKVFVSLLFLISFAMPQMVLAQPGLPSAPEQGVPIGGLALLAAGGGAYAIKKLRDQKKE